MTEAGPLNSGLLQALDVEVLKGCGTSLCSESGVRIPGDLHVEHCQELMISISVHFISTRHDHLMNSAVSISLSAGALSMLLSRTNSCFRSDRWLAHRDFNSALPLSLVEASRFLDLVFEIARKLSILISMWISHIRYKYTRRHETRREPSLWWALPTTFQALSCTIPAEC